MAQAFEKALKGYLGFLTGTGKSLATISSYKGDLKIFRMFIESNRLAFETLTAKEFAAFNEYMVRHGLKTNTRRRKIITARALFRYAHSRKQIAQSPAKFTRAPNRYEELPWIPAEKEVQLLQSLLKAKDAFTLRNRLIVQLLTETGMLVSELCSLKFTDIKNSKVTVPGKRTRELRLSKATDTLLRNWQGHHEGPYLLPGYNRHGVTTERMTTRGIELLFVRLASEANLPELKPKTLRHFAICQWLRKKIADAEIQRRMGVNENYSLHAYKETLTT